MKHEEDELDGMTEEQYRKIAYGSVETCRTHKGVRLQMTNAGQRCPACERSTTVRQQPA